MAMLGLLQLMASQDEMFETAKYFNAFWYPSQTFEIATFYKEAMSLVFFDFYKDSIHVFSRVKSALIDKQLRIMLTKTITL
jgi:hypothetical protein